MPTPENNSTVNLVKFYTCTQAKYDAATKVAAYLYFTTDTKRLYKGDTLYGGAIEYVSTLPSAGVTETLYYAADTNKISKWDGSKFVDAFLPFETTLTNTDSTVPTSKAVKTYVDTISGLISGAIGSDFTSDSTVKSYINSQISGAVGTLDHDDIGGEGKIITTIKEVDGIISGEAIDLTTSVVARTATTNVPGETAEAALSGLGDKIATLNGSDTTAGSVAKAVKDAKDALSGAIGGFDATSGFDATTTVKSYIDEKILAANTAITDEETARTNYDSFLSGAIGGTYTAEHTVYSDIEALSGAAVKVSGAAENAIVVSGDISKTIGLKINANDKFLSQTADGLSATISLKKVESGSVASGNASEYYLTDKDGNQIGDKIEIAKDQFLKDAKFVEGSGSSDDKLQFTFITEGGVEKVVDISLSGLFNEYTQAGGIKLTKTETGIAISGVVDGNSETFLTVGENGFKLSGVQDAIDAVETALTGAIGGTFDSTNTVKAYIDSTRDTINTNTTAALNLKLDDVTSGKAGQVIIAKESGKVQTSGVKIGGATLASTPLSTTLATQVAVSGAISGALCWYSLD